MSLLSERTLPTARRAYAAEVAAEVPPSRPPAVRVEDGVAVRLHEPAGRRAAGTVVWLHGGGFVLGDAAMTDGRCARLADAIGARVAAPDYPLAPEARLPQQIAACAAALGLARRLGGPVAVAGDSAGGGLAAALALRCRDRGEPLAGLALIQPMLDPRPGAADRLPAEGWTAADNAFAWSAALGPHPASIAPALAGSVSGLPPALVTAAGRDLFLAEDAAFAERLALSGVEVEFHAFPGLPHAFERFAPAHPAARRQADALTRFLTRVLEPPT